MRLGFVDRVERRTTYYLPKRPYESVEAYVRRFREEVRGLGNVLIVYRGRVIARRYL